MGETNASDSGAFSGRKVLLVGTGGIGAAIAHRLAGAGATIFGTYHGNRDGAAALEAQLPAGSWAGGARLDAVDPAAVQEIAGSDGAAAKALGGIDTLIVTTGHRHELKVLKDTEPELLHEILDTELYGPMLLVRAVLPIMLDAGFGRIVVIGSDSGKAGTLGDAASSAARAGLAGIARSVARETARSDVSINVVSPGPTDTQLLAQLLADEGFSGKVMGGTLKAVPKGRPARAQEVAAAVAHLASPEAGYTTGQVLSVSGGLTM